MKRSTPNAECSTHKAAGLSLGRWTLRVVSCAFVVLSAVLLHAETNAVHALLTRPTTDDREFLAETTILCHWRSLDDLKQMESRYEAYFAAYDVPATNSLYYAYANVVYQYARLLKCTGQYKEAVELIDAKEEVQLHGYLQHMLQSCKADVLVHWAETEEGATRTNLLNEAKRALDSMPW